MAADTDHDPEVRLRIAEGLDVVNISDNEVLIQFGSRSHPSLLFRDTDLTGVLGQVLGRLGTAAAGREEMLSRIAADDRDEAVRLIDRLHEQGILVDAAKNPVEQYLGYIFSGDTEIASRRVALIGAGPVGAAISELLLRHGIGEIRLLDGRAPDALWHASVDPGANGRTDPARPKPAQAGLADRLIALGYQGVTAVGGGGVLDDEALRDAVAGADLVVVAVERPDVGLAHRVNRVCLATGTRWVLAELDGSLGRIGPLFAPDTTACYNDLRALADAAGPSPLMARVYRRYAADRGADSFAPGLPIYASLVAGFASLAVVHTLLTGTSYLLGRMLTVNFDRMMIDVEDVLKLPRCPVCCRSRASYQPTFSAEVVTRAPSVVGKEGAVL